jgi:hypothetical protein
VREGIVALALVCILTIYTLVVTVDLTNRVNDLDHRLDRIEQEP